MAVTYKDVSGRWRCQVRRKGYPTQNKTFDTKKAANAWGIGIESSMNSGTFIAEDKDTTAMTVSKLLNRYLKEESIHKRSCSDDEQRARTLKRNLGAFSVSTLTNVVLNDYKRRRLAVRSPQTVAHELNLLHRAYVVGVKEWGLVLPRGIPNTSRPRLPPGRERRVTQNEIDLILEQTESEQLPSIVLLAVETAMRRGEILELEWGRVNFERCTLFIPRTKNDTPRTVPLSRAALDVLQPIRQSNGKVFTITGRNTSQAFKRAVDRAGIDGLRFHDLRHEATSRLFEKGLNVMEVASITGHKSMQMLKRYTHLHAHNLVHKLD